ncbi:MAG: hypothetical protein WHF31_15310 [Candidatus Dehalobacter alkaniphilus]
MKYDALMKWLKEEFPHLEWIHSYIRENKCISVNIGIKTRIIISIRKSKGFGVDFDNRQYGFCEYPDSLDELKAVIVKCIKQIDPKLLENVQESLL